MKYHLYLRLSTDTLPGHLHRMLKQLNKNVNGTNTSIIITGNRHIHDSFNIRRQISKCSTAETAVNINPSSSRTSSRCASRGRNQISIDLSHLWNTRSVTNSNFLM